MSIQELEKVIETLPRREVEALRAWIENYLEDQLELTPEFQAQIERSEREMAGGKGRRRNPSPQ